eukprot:TRINITY_DN7307_c0_g1_i6.p1 TRINITY_DN7307_c0_g1~~TRINITY_DN7307_c0_g1_i6.p1  ORF type:complete len:400 (+),score=95.70 TRINITY_DN7307_c0_g1_i6:64-1263(+)
MCIRDRNKDVSAIGFSNLRVIHDIFNDGTSKTLWDPYAHQDTPLNFFLRFSRKIPLRELEENETSVSSIPVYESGHWAEWRKWLEESPNGTPTLWYTNSKAEELSRSFQRLNTNDYFQKKLEESQQDQKTKPNEDIFSSVALGNPLVKINVPLPNVILANIKPDSVFSSLTLGAENLVIITKIGGRVAEFNAFSLVLRRFAQIKQVFVLLQQMAKKESDPDRDMEGWKICDSFNINQQSFETLTLADSTSNQIVPFNQFRDMTLIKKEEKRQRGELIAKEMQEVRDLKEKQLKGRTDLTKKQKAKMLKSGLGLNRIKVLNKADETRLETLRSKKIEKYQKGTNQMVNSLLQFHKEFSKDEVEEESEVISKQIMSASQKKAERIAKVKEKVSKRKLPPKW